MCPPQWPWIRPHRMRFSTEFSLFSPSFFLAFNEAQRAGSSTRGIARCNCRKIFYYYYLHAAVCCRFVGVALGFKSIENNCHINNPSTSRAYAFLGSLGITNPFAQGVREGVCTRDISINYLGNHEIVPNEVILQFLLG